MDEKIKNEELPGDEIQEEIIHENTEALSKNENDDALNGLKFILESHPESHESRCITDNFPENNGDAFSFSQPIITRREKIRKALHSFMKRCGLPDMLLARLLGIYMIISGINLKFAQMHDLNAVDNWKLFVQRVPTAWSIIWFSLAFILLTLLHTILPKKMRIFDPLAVFAGTMIFAVNLLWRSSNFYLGIAMIIVAVVFISYSVGKINHYSLERFPKAASGIIVLICTVAVGAFIIVCSCARHGIFATSCFDFGIFVQMFHSMVTDMTAVTTCERNEFLSHFNVHSSYIFYLLAPFYAIFPNENTLLIAQAVLAMGGVIPLFLIARNHNYKGIPLAAAGIIYVFAAGLIGPCFYDFHENAFLPTLLMWLLYAVDKRKIGLFYVMSVLVCIVKEDAPLYVMCIALFLFFDEKKRKRIHGIIITVLSGIYFIIITNWLNVHGDGQLMAASRFGNLTIDPEAGFAGIVKNVISNPAYFFSLFIKEDTLVFFLQMTLPLLFLPFMTRKIHRFLLIIPFVIMNLVVGAGYGYAANIRFQYVFGTECLLIYMALINCEDLERKNKNTLVIASAAASVLTSVCLFSNLFIYYENYYSYESHYTALDECLDTVPSDASVIAYRNYLPHIADRSEIYIFDSNDFTADPYDETKLILNLSESYDFYVMSLAEDITEYAVPQLEAAGYTKFNEVPDYLVIYVSPDYVFAG